MPSLNISAIRGTLTRLEDQLSRLEASEDEVADARLRLVRMAVDLSSALPKAKYPVRHHNDIISSAGVTLHVLVTPEDSPFSTNYATGATGDSVLEAAVVLLEHEGSNEL